MCVTRKKTIHIQWSILGHPLRIRNRNWNCELTIVSELDTDAVNKTSTLRGRTSPAWRWPALLGSTAYSGSGDRTRPLVIPFIHQHPWCTCPGSWSRPSRPSALCCHPMLQKEDHFSFHRARYDSILRDVSISAMLTDSSVSSDFGGGAGEPRRSVRMDVLFPMYDGVLDPSAPIRAEGFGLGALVLAAVRTIGGTCSAAACARRPASVAARAAACATFRADGDDERGFVRLDVSEAEAAAAAAASAALAAAAAATAAAVAAR